MCVIEQGIVKNLTFGFGSVVAILCAFWCSLYIGFPRTLQYPPLSLAAHIFDMAAQPLADAQQLMQLLQDM